MEAVENQEQLLKEIKNQLDIEDTLDLFIELRDLVEVYKKQNL